ncbi:MAG: glycerate-2-kinase family protein [Vicinamibacterales bacterium]
MFERQCWRSRQHPPQANRHRHRPFFLLRPQTQSLTSPLNALRADLFDIARAGIRAVDAGVLVRDHLAQLGNDCPRVSVIAAGKASIAMAHAASVALGERIAGGLVVAPERPQMPLPFETIVGEHPQPGAGSEAAARRALTIAGAVPPDALLLVLISGGASSLLALPAEGLTLEDKRAATGVLLRSGADIHALNTVRKHLSAIKGGRLAAACAARTVALVLSDVVGDDLSVIASGPTVADPSTYGDAFTVIDRFGGRDAYPPAVVAHVMAGSRGERPESPKPETRRLGAPYNARRRTPSCHGGRCC